MADCHSAVSCVLMWGVALGLCGRWGKVVRELEARTKEERERLEAERAADVERCMKLQSEVGALRREHGKLMVGQRATERELAKAREALEGAREEKGHAEEALRMRLEELQAQISELRKERNAALLAARDAQKVSFSSLGRMPIREAHPNTVGREEELGGLSVSPARSAHRALEPEDGDVRPHPEGQTNHLLRTPLWSKLTDADDAPSAQVLARQLWTRPSREGFSRPLTTWRP